jgi:hypothetical protein
MPQPVGQQSRQRRPLTLRPEQRGDHVDERQESLGDPSSGPFRGLLSVIAHRVKDGESGRRAVRLTCAKRFQNASARFRSPARSSSAASRPTIVRDHGISTCARYRNATMTALREYIFHDRHAAGE